MPGFYGFSCIVVAFSASQSHGNGGASQVTETQATAPSGSMKQMPASETDRKVKKVAFFSGNYNYVMDGSVRALNMLVGFLERCGLEVLVFAPTAKEPAFDHVGTLISVPSVPVPGRSEYRIGLGLTPSVKRHLEAFNPDLVHLAAPDLLGRAALKWANKKGVPAVASFHTRFDTYPRYYGLKWTERYLTTYMRNFYRRCEHVYVPSQSMMDVLIEQGLDHGLRLWTRGVDMVLFSPNRRDMMWRRAQGFKDSDVVIAFIGRLVLEKGLDIFADTLEQLIARGVTVKALVVGDGPKRQRFEERLEGAVFTGFQGGEDLARSYASADIFFNASVTETFGNVTLEAMASGLPCVCADATGSQTLVADGESGYLIDPQDREGFADKLEELAKDPEKRSAFGQKAATLAKNFSWDSVMSDLLLQYEEAAEHYAPKRLAATGASVPPDNPPASHS